jgi:hypothetical protein
MYDRQTESLWSQLYGAAVQGPLEGHALSLHASLHTDWETWRAWHPDTLVLSKEKTCAQFNCGTYSSNPRGSYQMDPYVSYYSSPEEGVVDAQIPRDGEVSGGKTRVLGVRVGGEARAYPFEVFSNQTLIHDQIAGMPVLVWFDRETETGAAFMRRVDGQTLTFRQVPDRSDLLVDEGTGSRWDATIGIATAGSMQGTRLPPLVSTSAFEFGWRAYFPESEFYTP